MKIVGSSKQDGMPSPDNPVEIKNETVLIITDKEGNKKEMPFKYEKILKEGDKIEKINRKWCLVRRKPMNDIEILENLEKYISFANKQENFSHDTDYKWHKELASMIENLIQRNKDLEQIEKEHKEENGRLRDKIKELEEKQIHRYNKECLNCGVNFIAKRIDTGYCKKCSHIVANRKYKQKNKEKVNAYAKIYMRKRRANKVKEK